MPHLSLTWLALLLSRRAVELLKIDRNARNRPNREDHRDRVVIVNYFRTSSGREGRCSPCRCRTEQKERRDVVSISSCLV
jgi:hypothetical protein